MPIRNFRFTIVLLFLLATRIFGQGTLTVYFSPPTAQSTTVSGVSTETFDALSTGVQTAAYTSAGGLGTYTGSTTNPFAILAHDEYGGATDSAHTTPTNYLGLGGASGSSNPVILTLAQPAAYFGFWWSAGDASNRVDLYQGGTLFATFSTANLLTFLNNGSGTITAINGTTYNTSAYFGNPNITSGANDSAEPFVYISFVITGATIDTLAFYNTSATGSTFESDNHSVIFAGNTVTIPTTFVPVETLSLTPTAATPTFSPAAGTYTAVQTVTINTTTSGASIRYTTDGSTPSETAGTLYSAPVTVGATQTLNAIAYGTGLADSAIATAAYTINLPVVATPTFSPAAGTYTSAQTVTINTTTPGASIRFTTDGSTPTETTGTLYSAPVVVNTTETLKAIAYETGMADSSVATAAYSIPITVTLAPTALTLYPAQTQQFTATVLSTTNTAVTWSISPAIGAISSAGLYTAPGTISALQTVTVTATSQADNTKVGTATITLSGSLSVGPSTASLGAGQTQQFAASQNGSAVSVTWAISPAGAGTISGTGLYTAPPCVTAQQTVTITATSTTDTTKAAAATLILVYANDYTYRRAIVMDHTKVPNTDQTNFPVLINSTDTTLASVLNGGHVQNANGYDLVFASDASCATTLNFEVEAWNATTGQLTAWVQVPVLSHTTDTPIYMCYGNAAITTAQANPTAVWDANYLAVYHLGRGSALSLNDSTSNGYNATQASNSNQVALAPSCQFAECGAFQTSNNTNAYLNLPFKFGGGDLTVQAWVNPQLPYNQNSVSAMLVGDLTDNGSNGVDLGYIAGYGSVYSFTVGYNGTFAYANGPTYTSDTQLGRNTWQMLVGRIASQVPSLWQNGTSIASAVQNGSGSFGVMNNNASIGNSQTLISEGVHSEWTGYLQEVRISNIARSDDWIIAEYNNQNSPATFYTLYPENIGINITPLVSYIYPEQSQQLSAVVSSCASSAVTWSIGSGAPGSISSGGLYTGPSSISTTQAITVTATSQADGQTSGTATVTVFAPIGVSVTPAMNLMTVGLTQQFTATLTNATNNAVTWTINPAIGSISSTGLYTAPSSVTTTQTLTVTATSVTDPTKSGLATITLIAQVGAPAFSIPAGLYSGPQTLTLTSATPYSTIRYTTDGSTPSETTGTLYTGPFTISNTVTISAIAYLYGQADSTIATATYTFTTAATATVHFITTDTSTQGNWIGTYGKDGFYIPTIAASYFPAYLSLYGLPGFPTALNPSTYEVSALQKPAPATDRIASEANPGGGIFGTNFSFTDGQTHQLAVYFLDWFNGSQIQTITLIDLATNAVLDTRTVQSFGQGKYLVWTIQGNVAIVFNAPASDAHFAALFFDPPGVSVSPLTSTLSPGQTQQFTAVVGTSTNQAVNWSISPAGVGTINSSGLYLAPSSVVAQQTVTITAASQANPAIQGTATVTLLPGTNDGLTQALSIVAKSLCVIPHVAPTVNAGADQYVILSCGGGQPPCSVSVTLTGSASNFSLNPGDTLNYAWNVLSGPAPVQLSTANTASTTAAFTTAGTYTLQLNINDGVSTSGGVTHVYVSPAASGGGSLTLSPSVIGPVAINTPVSLVATWLNGFATEPVTITITGANPQTQTVVTRANPGGDYLYTVSFTYTAANAGVDTIVATASSGFISNAVTVTWITTPAKLTSSPVTALFFPADGSGVFNTVATQTPAFTQVFPSINFDPAPGTVTGNTSAVTNQTRPFTDIVTDQNGNFVGSIVAQGTDYQAGSGPMYSFSGVFTGTLNVPAAGPVTFSITSDDGFIFGIGNGATRVSGPQTNTPAATPFQSYAVMGGVNQREDTSASTITVNFPAAGAYPYELDYAKGGDKNLTLTMLANGAPLPAAALLTLSPATVPTSQAGQIQQFVLAATDVDGQALANLPVTFTVTGENPQTRLLTTDATGQAGFAYAGGANLFGTDTLQAAANVNGANAFSNVVTIQWNTGTNQAPVVSAGTAQTITLPSQAVLYGSVTDDGLPNNTLTITWSMQSGPAAVVFDDPAQAATAATFSTPGTYVLLLTASDGVLTATSTVTITVNQATTWSSGWLANPLNNASVTGQVPVTLISGVTLTSGTLTYYPANNQSAVVTLSGSTTGAGQIGLFDATLITNGEYFIELRATNSLGVTQDNLVLVTVVGQYKPGRVTATITDLTVPAPGLPIQIQRTYDSLVRSTSGDFGYGWNLGVNIQTSISISGDVTLTVNGQTRTFYFTPQAPSVLPYWVPQYTAEPGFYGSLMNTGDNCSGVLVQTGNLFGCGINNAGSVYQANGFKYTDPYGRVYTMAANGNLQSVQDLSGNTLTITPTGLTSTNGLSVPFVRDTSGRITQITDTLGNKYVYSYDTNGNLSTVTYPGIATPSQYQYDPTHLMTKEIDQRGNTAGASTYYASGRIQSTTDAVGNTTQYAYNTSTNTTTITNPDGGTQTTVYDSYGMPLSATDPLGRTTTYTYDSNHNQISMTDALGKTTQSSFNTYGFLTSITDPLGNIYAATYNPVGGPTAVTNPLNQTQNVTYDSSYRISAITDTLGNVGAFTYNATGQPLTLVDARGNTSTYTYDQYGNRTNYTDPINRQTVSVYDTQGNLSSQTDPRGNKTQFAYDALNRKISTTDAAGNVTSYAYDGDSNKISDTDALSRVTGYTYDAANRRTQTTFADSTAVSTTYDWRNHKLTETDQLGRVTKYVYDLAGQLTSTTVAFGTSDAATTTYTYDLDGRQLTQTDPRGNTTTNGYDAAGRLISVTDAIGNVTQFGQDAKGQRTSMTDAKNRVTNYTYDSRGRQLTTTTPDSKTVSKSYDGLGLVLTVTDEENRTTTYGYDGASQLLSVKDALSELTQYSYDPAGNKLTQEDANSHTTSYTWDNLNRRISRVLPAGQAESYTYDAVGNVATRTDFNGKTTTFGYDSLNRLLSRTPDASFSASPISFTYTSTGQRATMNDPGGSTTYTYTNRDQVSTKATPQGTLSYIYDPAGNVTSVQSSNASGTNVTYAWNADNRLQSVMDSRLAGATTTYSYDATNQVSSFSYPNGVTHAYTYDLRDRVLTLNGYTQTFSPSGRKLSAVEATGRAANYTYDSIYRLTNETISGDPTPANNGALTYALDPVGNRQSTASTLAAIPTQSFTYDADDRISGDTLDANGNTLTSGGVTFTYDFEDRLLSSSGGVQIVYDGDGNRVSEIASGTTTNYLIDDFTPTGYPQVVEEVVNGAVANQLTYGLMRVSQRGTATSYYGYDGGGSVRQLFDPTGAVTDTYAYDAFGNIAAHTGSTVNEFRYRGEQYDPSLQMYYLRARYYRPQIGRFLTQDTYEGEEEQPVSLHQYLYADADPVNNLDVSGHDDIIESSAAQQVQRQPILTRLVANMRGLTLGQVQRGAKIAYDTICCLDKTWSVLGLALDSIAAETGDPGIALPTDKALSLIDAACKLDCSTPGKDGKPYIIYGKKNGDGVYFGRTGQPFGRRMNGHAIGGAGTILFETTEYAVYRGLEQLLIGSAGGIGSEGLLNRLNGVGPRNGNFSKYIKCAERFLQQNGEGGLGPLLNWAR